MRLDPELEAFVRGKAGDLPGDWELYSIESLPKRASVFTHVEAIGSVPRIFKSGPRKGRKTWSDGVEERTFIVSFEELEEWRTVQEAENDDSI